MSDPIFPLSIDKVRQFMGVVLTQNPSLNVQHITLSICEYLKDAERWQYVESYEIPQGMSRNETRKWVDTQLEELKDDIERVIRPRQRRQDGISGGSGAGNTPNPVV